MRRILTAVISFAVVSAAVVSAAAVRAEDAVTFKLTQPKPEDRVRVSQSDKSKTTRTTTINGKKSVATDQSSSAWVYVGEVVGKGGNDETSRSKRTYQKFESQANGRAEPAPPLNVPILIEKKNDQYTFSAGEKRLSPTFVKRLEAEFSPATQGVTPIEMLPAVAVKPGESWKIDAAKAFAGTGKITLDAERGTMSGKLVKVYQKDGRQYATIEFAASAPVKSLGPEVALVPKEGSVAELKMTVDACIDGTDPYSRTTSRVTFRVEGAVPGGTLAIIHENLRNETIELAQKK